MCAASMSWRSASQRDSGHCSGYQSVPRRSGISLTAFTAAASGSAPGAGAGDCCARLADATKSAREHAHAIQEIRRRDGTGPPGATTWRRLARERLEHCGLLLVNNARRVAERKHFEKGVIENRLRVPSKGLRPISLLAWW